MACKYVKDFDFGPAKTYVKPYARGGKVCKAEGGEIKADDAGRRIRQPMTDIDKQLARSGMLKDATGGKPSAEESLALAKMYASAKGGYKKGGKVAKVKAIPVPVKEPSVTRTVQNTASRTVSQSAPAARRGVPVAPASPLLAMKKGGQAKVGPKGQAKVGVVMGEFKKGALHSGQSGKIVTNPKQAVAIALSEARRVSKTKK